MSISQRVPIRSTSRELAEPVDLADATLDLRDGAKRLVPQRAAEHRATGNDRPGVPVPVAPGRPYLSTRLAVRTFDLTVTVLASLILAPVMLAVAVAVYVDSSGPVLYGSQRLGHKKATFTAWKFRSMHPDADARLKHLLQTDSRAAREYKTYHKLKEDPRLTRVGRLIRRTSLDELPQLYNILLGDMSVVGPRPNLVHEGKLFRESLQVVLQVRPGLTGLWQVSGRNRLSVHDRVLMDVHYAHSRTMAGDLRICLRTFLQLWRPGKHGAY